MSTEVIARIPGIQGSIPEPQGAEDLPASGDLAPRQFIASKRVLFERCLIGEVRRPLGGDRTGSRTASYSLGSDESGNFGIAIVVRHDCLLIAGHSEHGALLVLCLRTELDLAQPHQVTSYFT
jgi:hypothetical protein